MERREYSICPIKVNYVLISKVIIDPHFEFKHGDSINDDLILKLVKKLDGRIEIPEARDDEGFSYFATLIEHNERLYRLV